MKINLENKQDLGASTLRQITYIIIIIIVIRQPLCPVFGRRPQHAVSK